MRLIDADAWYEFYIECTKDLDSCDHYHMGYGVAMDYVDDWLDARLTIDAVEVVRCKDCKHYDSHGYKICKLHSVEASQFGSGENIYMERDDFCSYGERSGEDDDQ